MKRARIKLGEGRSYPLILGAGLFPRLAEELKKNFPAHNYVIISDCPVMKLYGGELFSLLRKNRLGVHLFDFPAGEENKNRKIWEQLIIRMLRAGIGRDSLVIALGGGVVSDLAGFVSAVYMRGIPWVAVPTTLLGMVDASIGGKVGIDLAYGKNLVGAFWQASAVYMDLEVLRTLPRLQFKNGLAEVVKAGLIKDKELFALLERNWKRVLRLSLSELEEIIWRAVRVKVRVVEKDEREESGERKILNYAHTIGHGLEALSGYKLLHGIAVSLGMRVEARISNLLGYFPEAELKRQNQLLFQLGFPSRVSGLLAKKLKTRSGKEQFMNYLYKDKKVRAGKIEMVLLREIGRVKRSQGSWTVPVEERVIEQALEEIL